MVRIYLVHYSDSVQISSTYIFEYDEISSGCIALYHHIYYATCEIIIFKKTLIDRFILT